MNAFNLKRIAQIIISPKQAIKLSSNEWFQLILILREAKLLANLYHSSIRDDCFAQYPEYAQRHLKSAYVYADRQRIQVIYESVTIVELLSEIKVTPIFLKGANYILQKTVNSRGRIVSDIDLLVDKKDLTKVERFLKARLWKSEELSDYDNKYYRNWAHEIPPMYHILRNTVLDIHHNVYLPISGRSPNISRFTSDAKKTEFGCVVLSDSATILHSIIHLFMNEDFTNSFRDLLDIHLLISEFESELFWSELLQLSCESGFEKELYYAVCLRDKLFNVDSFCELTELKSRHDGFLGNKFINVILYQALTPKHIYLNTFHNRTATFIIFLRGHWLKMPTHILIKHLLKKSYQGMVEKLFGKHFLEKD
jgi:hypothetical protein